MKALSGMLSNPDGNMSQLLVNMGRDGAHLGENSSWQWTFWSGTDGVGTAMALIRCLAVICALCFRPRSRGRLSTWWVPIMLACWNDELNLSIWEESWTRKYRQPKSQLKANKYSLSQFNSNVALKKQKAINNQIKPWWNFQNLKLQTWNDEQMNLFRVDNIQIQPWQKRNQKFEAMALGRPRCWHQPDSNSTS